MRELAAFRFRISDSEWQKVRVPLDLPELARAWIDELIGMFRLYESAERDEPGAKTRAAIESSRNAARALRERLAALDKRAIDTMLRREIRHDFAVQMGPAAEDVEACGPLFLKSTPAHDHVTLSEQIAAVAALEARLDAAVSRIERRPTRSRGNLVWLVKGLDAIARENGAPLSRSYKSASRDFVDNVVCVADPDIGPGSVDEAMKALISVSVKPAT